MSLSISSGSAVGLFGVNSADWMLVDLALHAYSMIAVPLYDTLGPDSVQYICGHAELVAVAVAAPLLPTLIKVLPACPTVTAVVRIRPARPAHITSTYRPSTTLPVLPSPAVCSPRGACAYTLHSIQQRHHGAPAFTAPAATPAPARLDDVHRWSGALRGFHCRRCGSGQTFGWSAWRTSSASAAVSRGRTTRPALAPSPQSPIPPALPASPKVRTSARTPPPAPLAPDRCGILWQPAKAFSHAFSKARPGPPTAPAHSLAASWAPRP